MNEFEKTNGDIEAEKIYATQSNIIDVCSGHHKELSEKDYQ